MCGISFLLDRTGRFGPGAAARMRAATAHRGPDGCGSHQFGDGGPGTVYLGHNRLRIVDLSDEARQPMLSADGRYALVFNGEIYNWRELRVALEAAGVSFRTQSDTEVLLHLLIREDAAALPKLRGMFAFVFYDSGEQRVLAARDEHGIKPLYWAESAAGLAVSSEISGVQASGLAPAGFNPEALTGYLKNRYAYPVRTFAEEVYELGGGEKLRRFAHRFDSVDWLDAVAAPQSYSSQTPTERLSTTAAHLRLSLERHLTADVPVGIWLSGGVDSTLLLALAQEMGHHPPCFSVGLQPAEGSFGTDDYAFARRAARQYGADYQEFTADASLLTHTDEALAALGQPIADSSVLLTWWLARQTRATGVKAVLSGAGADEWFGGYNRHRAFAWYVRHARWLQPLAPALRGLGQTLPSGLAGPWRKPARLLRHLTTRLSPTDDLLDVFDSFRQLDPVLSALLHPSENSPEQMGGYLTSAPEALAGALHLDRTTYLPQDILALTDQTAMRHGLEVRTPYLDQDLTRFVATIPANELLRPGPKWLLRELLNQRGGQAFTKRSKEGFGLPLTRWLRMPKYGWLFDPVRRPDHPLFEHLDYGRTQQFLARFRTGRHDLGAEAWALVTLFRWYDLQEVG